jgi:DNA polymerase III epsilon subunit-like protein
MILQPYCVFDFETGSRNPKTTQPIQLAAVMVDPIKCTIIEGSEFNSLIKPLSDKDAEKQGLTPIQDDALQVNKKTREELALAPELENVWNNFTAYVKNYQKGKNSNWNAPIPVGFNIAKFDLVIVDRLAKQYGPWDDKEERQKLFHPIYYKDMMQDFFSWFENWNQIKSYSQASLLELAGITDLGDAHDALVDVKGCAEAFTRFLKLYRNINAESGPKIKWKRT